MTCSVTGNCGSGAAAVVSALGPAAGKFWPGAALVFGVTGVSGMAVAAWRLDGSKTAIVGASAAAVSFALAQRVYP
ncbi:MAG: hypothetical protein EBY28_25825 [Betaproteobacteria bacterium]|nr:hypothetical protein [Betaproteobacteria bacterium]